MSEFSDSQKKKYAQAVLQPGQRAWFFRLTGHTMTPERKKLFTALSERAWNEQGKIEPWMLFRLDLEQEPDNKFDPNAVRVLFVRRKDEMWNTLQLGYVPLNERGKGQVYHSKAISHFLGQNLVIYNNFIHEGLPDYVARTVHLVHIHYDARQAFGSAHLAVLTPWDATDLPSGVKALESAYMAPESREIVWETLSHKDCQPEAPPATAPAWTPPSEKTIDRLISLHKEFISYFTYEDSGGTCSPCFMVQCTEPRPYKDETSFAKDWESGHDQMWLFPDSVENLKVVEKDYGPTMAKNYYRFTGLYSGPFEQGHATQVLNNVTEVMNVLRKMEEKS